MKINTFKKFLATGEMPRETDVLDEALAKYERETSDVSLEEHDRRYHSGGYKEGDSCEVREAKAKEDKVDSVKKDISYYKNGLEINKAQLKETTNRLNIAEEAMKSVQKVLIDIGRRDDPRVELCFAMLEAARTGREDFLKDLQSGKKVDKDILYRIGY